MPCYNEVDTLEAMIQAVLRFPYEDKEIVVVDDGSTDGTTELLKSRVEAQVTHVVYHGLNRGKGASIRSALRAVTGDIVLIQDTDLEYDPVEYEKLLQPILMDKADVVYGSRFIGGDSRRVLYFWHSLGNKILTLFSNILTDLNLSDMETGFKVFTRRTLDHITIQENRFGFEPEITAKMAKLQCRIYEVGIGYQGRTYQQGKKIKWWDGLWAVWCILKYNLSSAL